MSEKGLTSRMPLVRNQPRLRQNKAESHNVRLAPEARLGTPGGTEWYTNGTGRVPWTPSDTRAANEMAEHPVHVIATHNFPAPLVIRHAMLHGSNGRPCWIYFVRAAAPCGLIKIGRSANVVARLEELRCSSPVELTLEGAFEANSSVEPALHILFDQDRVRGEWFRPSPALEALIDLCRPAKGAA